MVQCQGKRAIVGDPLGVWMGRMVKDASTIYSTTTCELNTCQINKQNCFTIMTAQRAS